MTTLKHSNRRDFIKRIGGLTAIGVGSPQVISSNTLENSTTVPPSNRTIWPKPGYSRAGNL